MDMKIPNSVNFTPSLIFKMGNFIWRASALLNPMNCKRKFSQCAYHVQILYYCCCDRGGHVDRTGSFHTSLLFSPDSSLRPRLSVQPLSYTISVPDPPRRPEPQLPSGCSHPYPDFKDTVSRD